MPDNIDVLLVEQEVVADERTALQAVVEADLQLMELRRVGGRVEALRVGDTYVYTVKQLTWNGVVVLVFFHRGCNVVRGINVVNARKERFCS